MKTPDIRTLAQLLRRRLRKSDVVGRYGGEEFALLMPDTCAERALEVLDLYALWNLNPDTRLRFSASNILPRDYANSSAIDTGATVQSVDSSGATSTVWSLRLELKL
jgi:GGDEF domain-containing protein